MDHKIVLRTIYDKNFPKTKLSIWVDHKWSAARSLGSTALHGGLLTHLLLFDLFIQALCFLFFAKAITRKDIIDTLTYLLWIFVENLDCFKVFGQKQILEKCDLDPILYKFSSRKDSKYSLNWSHALSNN